MDLVVFENHKPYVLDEFREGRFDYVELASDVAETKFFQYLFVPDNGHYEGSMRLLFDEHNHPVSKKQEQERTMNRPTAPRWRVPARRTLPIPPPKNGNASGGKHWLANGPSARPNRLLRRARSANRR
jgi:hypothetical protein